jgi:hypothetical protein
VDMVIACGGALIGELHLLLGQGAFVGAGAVGERGAIVGAEGCRGALNKPQSIRGKISFRKNVN